MDILIKLLPIITSVVISILFFIIRIGIKNQFDKNLKTLENELKEKYDEKRQALEYEFKLKYDDKIQLKHNLDLLYKKFMDLNSFFEEKNYNTDTHKKIINIVFSDIQEILKSINLYLSDDLEKLTESLFNHSNGIEYMEHHGFETSKYEKLKNDFKKQLKNERND